MTRHLFAYGTLMCEDIIRSASGCSMVAEAAVLKGFYRRALKGGHYPAIVPGEEHEVGGVLYRNVTANACSSSTNLKANSISAYRLRCAY